MNEICQKIKRKENGSRWKLKKQFKGHLKQNASNGTGYGELLQLYKTLKFIKDPRILLESLYSYTERREAL